MNKIEVIGNLGGDATLREIGGRQYVNFSVADSHKRGEETTVTWFAVTSGNTALAPYLAKGKKVFVRGRLTAKTYVNRDGVAVPSLTVWANEIELLGGGEGQQGQGGAPTGGQPALSIMQRLQQLQQAQQPQPAPQVGQVEALPF